MTIYCAGITTYAYRIGRLWYCARCLSRVQVVSDE